MQRGRYHTARYQDQFDDYPDNYSGSSDSGGFWFVLLIIMVIGWFITQSR